MKIAVTGDVMLGRLVDQYMIRNPDLPPGAVWSDILPLLSQADLRLINLECVISTRGTQWRPESKPFHFRAHPRAIEALTAAQIDCVTLANNHILDYGYEALDECLTLLDHAGIARTGAGRNLSEALTPAFIETHESRLAVVALTDNEPEWEAAANRPGVNFVAYSRHGLIEPYRSRMMRVLSDARKRADVVIVSAHVGPNWGAPSAAMQALAHELIDLGADMYWGHSNHAPQGIEIYRNRPILYATGDFIDDYAIDPDERNDRSFLFIVEPASPRVERVLLYPVVIDRLRVRRAGMDESRWLGDQIRVRSAQWQTPVVSDHEWYEVAVTSRTGGGSNNGTTDKTC